MRLCAPSIGYHLFEGKNTIRRRLIFSRQGERKCWLTMMRARDSSLAKASKPVSRLTSKCPTEETGQSHHRFFLLTSWHILALLIDTRSLWIQRRQKLPTSRYFHSSMDTNRWSSRWQMKRCDDSHLRADASTRGNSVDYHRTNREWICRWPTLPVSYLPDVDIQSSKIDRPTDIPWKRKNQQGMSESINRTRQRMYFVCYLCIVLLRTATATMRWWWWWIYRAANE